MHILYKKNISEKNLLLHKKASFFKYRIKYAKWNKKVLRKILFVISQTKTKPVAKIAI